MPRSDAIPIGQPAPNQGAPNQPSTNQAPVTSGRAGAVPITPESTPSAAPADSGSAKQPELLNQPADTLPALNPATATMGDYLAKLHQLGSGLSQIGQAAVDYGRSAANTFGLYDRTVASAQTSGFQQDPTTGQWVSINDPAKEAAALKEERAKTAAAQERLGPMLTFLSNMTGSGPFAALKIGRTTTAAIPGVVPQYVRGILGGAVEGGTAGGLSAAGHDDDIVKGIETGSLWGGGVSALGGVGRSTEAPPQPTPRDVLQANHDAIRTEMGTVKFDQPTVDQAYRDAVLSLTPDQRANISNPMRQTVIRQRTENARAGGVTADSVNGFARNIFDRTITDGDGVLAARIRDNLLKNTLNAPTQSGHPSGYAADLNTQANEATARLGDHDWLANTNILKAPGEAATRLNDPRMVYGSNERDALTNLANYAKPNAMAGQPTGPVQGAVGGFVKSLWDAMAAKAAPLTATAIGGIVPGAEAFAAQGLTGAAKGGWQGARNAAILRAIDAAKVATSTGQAVHPDAFLPQAPVRDLLRRAAITGIAASQ